MLEIACDESGYEGEKLVDTTTDVFAHASLDLSASHAAEILRELRARVGSPATQYKSNRLLRTKTRPVLEWILGPDSPLAGHGHVFLVDKVWHLLTKLGELVSTDIERLYRERSQRAYLLAAANDMLRGKDRPGVVDEFFRVVPATGRDRAELFRAWLREDPVTNSVLDPLVPAIVAAVRHWGRVVVLHDRQKLLPARRVELIRQLCGGDLIGLRFLDAASHPQIQLADILAGTIRKIAEDELNGHGDPHLVALLARYLDRSSIWGDAPSWSALTASRASGTPSAGG